MEFQTQIVSKDNKVFFPFAIINDPDLFIISNGAIVPTASTTADANIYPGMNIADWEDGTVNYHPYTGEKELTNVTVTISKTTSGSSITGQYEINNTGVFNQLTNFISNTDGFYYLFLIMDEANEIATLGTVYKENYSSNPSIVITTTGQESQHLLYNTLKDVTTTSNDPYDGGGNSDDDGGGGTFKDEDDAIPVPDLPDTSAADVGLITLYTPQGLEIINFVSYLWSSDFMDQILRLWADPMNIILGLNIVPFELPNDGSKTVKAGNVVTPIQMTHATSQWASVDCGSLSVKEYYGGYMDYSPYTKFSIYLPYIGIRQLNTDDIMNNTIHVVYHCDALTGACIAYIQCGNKVLYSFSGNCVTQIPVTAQNMTQVYTAAIEVAASAGVAVATGGATAPQLASTMLNAAGSKPEVQKSGTSSGTSGLLGIQYPYLIKERPRQCTPKSQNKYTGYPSFTTKKLKNLKEQGLTKVDSIRLNKMSCTTNEKNEIMTLLKEGVIIK